MPIFFFNDTATTEIYTLSLHDALPICAQQRAEIVEELRRQLSRSVAAEASPLPFGHAPAQLRSEEHTSELQSRSDLVCRLLLEKKMARAVNLGAGTYSQSAR